MKTNKNPKKVTILGSTGSIGTSALRVIAVSENLKPVGLSAYKSYRRLFQIAEKYKVKTVQLNDEKALPTARAHKPAGIRMFGPRELEFFLEKTGADIFLSGIAGAAGLPATLAVLRAGKDLALANKESLVMAGRLVMNLAKQNKCQLIPVDSEHSSIFRLLRGVDPGAVQNIWLTASGGPFLDKKISSLAKVTPAQAVAHPNWKMGQRISVDSATMFNKALEVIEAHHLFRFPAGQIKAIIHPQSLVHGLIEMKDGSMRADISQPDMKLPISYALSYPETDIRKFKENFFKKDEALQFTAIARKRYPIFSLGYRAIRKGHGLGAVINAADEEAVRLFLNRKIKFLDITKITKVAANKAPKFTESRLDDIWAADRWGRAFVNGMI